MVGPMLVFIAWQTHWINKLLDRNENLYRGEIERMNVNMNRLLDKVLGPQESSGEMPTVKEIGDGAEKRNKPGNRQGEGDKPK